MIPRAQEGAGEKGMERQNLTLMIVKKRWSVESRTYQQNLGIRKMINATKVGFFSLSCAWIIVRRMTKAEKPLQKSPGYIYLRPLATSTIVLETMMSNQIRTSLPAQAHRRRRGKRVPLTYCYHVICWWKSSAAYIRAFKWNYFLGRE